jgi:hypothetical protein
MPKDSIYLRNLDKLENLPLERDSPQKERRRENHPC